MAKFTIDEDLLEFFLSLIEDDIDKEMLEIILKNENEEIVVQEMIRLMEQQNND